MRSLGNVRDLVLETISILVGYTFLLTKSDRFAAAVLIVMPIGSKVGDSEARI